MLKVTRSSAKTPSDSDAVVKRKGDANKDMPNKAQVSRYLKSLGGERVCCAAFATARQHVAQRARFGGV